jgi:glycerol-3-phosphate cytidylyltransferase
MRYLTDVLTLGTFDIPHVGHASFLKECEQYGSVLVGLNTDSFVERYKGARPLYSYDERARLLNKLGFSTVPNDGPGKRTIVQYRPRIVAIGTDWLRRDYLSQIDMTAEDFERLGVSLLYIPYTESISTSDIRRRLGG